MRPSGPRQCSHRFRSANAFEVTVERLAHSIRLGVLVEGDQLPPERELAETFGVSRVTLREAIKALRAANLVESPARARGGGTFVVAPPHLRWVSGRRSNGPWPQTSRTPWRCAEVD